MKESNAAGEDFVAAVSAELATICATKQLARTVKVPPVPSFDSVLDVGDHAARDHPQRPDAGKRSAGGSDGDAACRDACPIGSASRAARFRSRKSARLGARGRAHARHAAQASVR